MTEYSIPLEVLQNGAGDEPAPKAEGSLPRVDAERGVFITSWGNEITLNDTPVNSLIVQFIQQQGKPTIPMIEVTLLGKHKQLEPFPQHEGYLALLKEWSDNSNLATLRYLIDTTVKGVPPDDFVEQIRVYVPNATKGELKYLWVCSLMPDDDLGIFTESVMGRWMPTEKGLQESADSFRG